MKVQKLHLGGVLLSFPPRILYCLPVHIVRTQGRWVPLGGFLTIIKWCKLYAKFMKNFKLYGKICSKLYGKLHSKALWQNFMAKIYSKKIPWQNFVTNFVQDFMQNSKQ